jgi:hypothetical protein
MRKPENKTVGREFLAGRKGWGGEANSRRIF